jgi:hypothetical protein
MATFPCTTNGRLLNHLGLAAAPYVDTHDAPAATSLPTGIQVSNAKNTGTNKYFVSRFALDFDTSAIPAGVTIKSASLWYWNDGSASEKADAGHADLHVVEGVHHTPVVANDYGDQLPKVTSGGVLAFGDQGAGWNEIILNATGLTWIVKGGLTRLCLKLSGDGNNLQPTGFNIVYGDGCTGFGHPPELDVTWGTTVPTVDGQSRFSTVGLSSVSYLVPQGRRPGWLESLALWAAVVLGGYAIIKENQEHDVHNPGD